MAMRSESISVIPILLKEYLHGHRIRDSDTYTYTDTDTRRFYLGYVWIRRQFSENRQKPARVRAADTAAAGIAQTKNE